jgi:CRP-like cAMP-binding protein
VKFDGWLEKCAQFDEGALPSDDPMASVLEKVIVLRDSSLFAGLSGEELFPVAEIAEPVMIPAGAFAVREGDPGDALFVVVSGTFSIRKGATKLHEIARGGIFGELSLLDGAPRAASVKAESDGRLLRIPRAEFEALLDESPELSRGVIRTLLGHLRAGA